MNKETFGKIIDTLKILTMQNKLTWNNHQGCLICRFQEDEYMVTTMGLLVNRIMLPVQDDSLLEFYDFLADRVVMQTCLNKLGDAVGINLEEN